MNYFSTDAVIVYVFLLITLGVGLWAGRKVQTIEDYAVANRSYGSTTLIITFLATWVGGYAILEDTQLIFKDGIINAIACLPLITSLLLLGYFVAPKVVQFKDCISMGDLMARFYGPNARLISAVASIGFTTALVAMQVVALGHVYQLLGFDNTWGMALAAAVIIIYSALGGIRSITVTDVVQFVVLIIVLPLLANVVAQKAGGIKQILLHVPADKLVVWGHEKFSEYGMGFMILMFFPIGLVSPPYIQRLLMANSKQQARDMYVGAAFFIPLWLLLITLMALASLVVYPNLTTSQVVPHIIQQLLPIGLKGFAIAGLLAVIMSSADSFLGAGSVVVSHDLIKPLFDKMKWPINELRAVRITTLLMGLLSVYLALQVDGKMLKLSFLALNTFGPIVAIPLVAGIMGLKTDSKIFMITLVATLTTFVAANLAGANTYLIFLSSVMTNLVTYFAAHYIRYKGFWLVDGAASFKFSFACLYNWFSKIAPYFQTKINLYRSEDLFFALFLCFNYMVPFFMYTRQHEVMVVAVRTMGVVLCTGLIFKNYWPALLKKYFYPYWYTTLWYCLPFSTILLYLLNGGGMEWTINIALSTMLLIVLANWASFMLLSALGAGMAVLYYHFFVGTPFHLSYEDTYALAYTAIFSVLIGLLFVRRKEQSFNSLLLQKQQLSENQQAIRREMADNLTYREELLKELQPAEAALFDEMTTAYIQQAIYRITDYMRLHVTSIKLNDLQKTISDFCQPAENYELVFKKHTQQTTLEGDWPKIKQLLVNAVEYIQLHNTQNNAITIALEDTQLGHAVAHMPGYTRTLDALKITISSANHLPANEPIYIIDPVSSHTWIPTKDDELLLIENARIIDAHYGYMAEKSTDTQGYVLPVKLREVRGKVMEIIKEPAVVDPAELNHPLAIQLETELFQKLKDTAVDTAVVKQALDLIKRYHGGVKRKSGEPFFTHPIAVALIILESSQDQAAILGGLLHDTVEDTSLSLKDIERLFGSTVAFLVRKATNLEDHRRRISLPDKENLTRILNYEDSRAALVKLADRLHNMRTIQHHTSLAKRHQIAQETLDEFVPLANKLGLDKIASELEKLSRATLSR